MLQGMGVRWLVAPAIKEALPYWTLNLGFAQLRRARSPAPGAAA